MKKLLSSCFVLAIVLQGCATAGGGQGPSDADLAKLIIGKTNAAEVRTLLGPPLRTTGFARMERDVWEYRRYNDPMDERHIAVQFSPDGVVREVVVVKDYTRELCGD
jgi:outer membrane protein assembly factor BamE (lipoprotein component of BamABCDE complex)